MSDYFTRLIVFPDGRQTDDTFQNVAGIDNEVTCIAVDAGQGEYEPGTKIIFIYDNRGETGYVLIEIMDDQTIYRIDVDSDTTGERVDEEHVRDFIRKQSEKYLVGKLGGFDSWMLRQDLMNLRCWTDDILACAAKGLEVDKQTAYALDKVVTELEKLKVP